MRRNSGGLAATLVGGVIASLLCALLAQIAGGLPAPVVDALLGATPVSLHPYLSELVNGFHHDLNSDDMPTAAFLVVQFGLWLVMWFTGWHLMNRPDSPVVLVSILGFAILFRAVLIPAVPVHASDFYRYLWDGKTTVHGINPYSYEPAAVMLRETGIAKPTEIEGHIYQGRVWSQTDEERLTVLATLRDEARRLHDRITAPYLLTPFPPRPRIFRSHQQLVWGFDSRTKAYSHRVRFGNHRLASADVAPPWTATLRCDFLCVVPARPHQLCELRTLRFNPSFFPAACDFPRTSAESFWGAFAIAAAGLSNLGALVFTPILFRRSWRNLITYLFVGLSVAAGFAPFIVWQEAGASQIFTAMIGEDADAPNLAGIFLGIDRACALLLTNLEERHLLARLVSGLLFLIFFSLAQLDPHSGSPGHVAQVFLGFRFNFHLVPACHPVATHLAHPVSLRLSTPQLDHLDVHHPGIFSSVPNRLWEVWFARGDSPLAKCGRLECLFCLLVA